MLRATMDRHELTRRGQAYYDQHLRAKLEPEENGKFLVLEVETGDYEVDDDEMAAIQRARAKHPQSVFFILRVGCRAAHRIRGGSLRRTP